MIAFDVFLINHSADLIRLMKLDKSLETQRIMGVVTSLVSWPVVFVKASNV